MSHSRLIRCNDRTIEVEVAGNTWERMRGLLGRGGLDSGKGLLVPHCSAVHTMFMRFPVDVVYLDRNMTVCGLRENMVPFRFSSCPGASKVLELAAGEAAKYRIVSGTVLA